LSGTQGSIVGPFIHLSIDGFIAVDWMLTQVLDIDAECLMLTHLEPSLGSIDGINQQVLHILIVDLDHAEHDFEPVRILLHGTNSTENLIARNGHDTDIGAISNHGV
jgi:hypothetical protein